MASSAKDSHLQRPPRKQQKLSVIQLLRNNDPSLSKDHATALVSCRNVYVDGELCTDSKAMYPKEAIVEVSFDGLRYLVSGDGDLLPLMQAGEIDEELLIHVLNAGDNNVVNDILAGDTRVRHFLHLFVGRVNCRGVRLRQSLPAGREDEKICRQEKFFQH